jgi:hypothetical protein
MKKTTLLTAMVLACCGAAAEAQVYVQPTGYGTYTVTQPTYAAPVSYAPAAPVSYAPAAYAPAAAYAPVTTYYAGNPCGQRVAYNCCNACCNPCCNPCAATYVSASPCAPQAVYSPVTCAPAPVACGPQACIRRGLLGQPTVYVPGQPVRNLFRFLTP